ncbi:GTPase HflX [Alkaliphilus sp. MSJ-5]|uniref:GTPase HflX n=1 Tax=Alkaliphilus flagellatus TaxID=2841507 RepID=A0ABS6G5B7_9FIRM|nr:GTPase HflX [Alkaliphilus flagellatus]
MYEKKSKAILVGLNNTGKKESIDIEISMNELSELTKAAGAEVLSIAIQNRPAVDVTYFIGKGKVDEIKQLCETLEADMVIFNDELSGSQIRNLEETLGVDVIDRTALILDIFAQRARTKEGKLQVELAQLKYRMPRLIGLGRQLSQQGAGIGTRGPGEKKLETDRRHILKRIDDIEQELKEVKKNREVQRGKRSKSELPIVALVGYTNAGKSTLMNSLLKMSDQYDEAREVYAEDMLFATLDVSLRRLSFPNKLDFILTDTVGFVSKLPHALVNAFKATLEEVKYADLLIHVIDASNEEYNLQKQTTLDVLRELGVENKNIINVYNKVDKILDGTLLPKEENALCISAKANKNLDTLIEHIRNQIGPDIIDVHLLIPYDKGNLISSLHNDGVVLGSEYVEEGIEVKARVEKMYYHKYESFNLDK